MAKFQTSSTTQTAGKPHPSQFSPCPKFIIRICRTLKFRTRLVLVHLALSCCVQLCSSLSKYGKEMLRRSVEELMNQQLDEVWKLRFPEKMWHFVVFFTIWSIWQRHVMSLPSGRCADRETFSVSLAKTPRVAGGEGHLFPKIWDQCGDQMVSDGIRCRSSWHISTYLDISRHSLTYLDISWHIST